MRSWDGIAAGIIVKWENFISDWLMSVNLALSLIKSAFGNICRLDVERHSSLTTQRR
jgi:hypothetical protein